MKTHLVIAREFGPYAKGDVVIDPATIDGILASDHAGHVVPTKTPDLIAATSKKDA